MGADLGPVLQGGCGRSGGPLALPPMARGPLTVAEAQGVQGYEGSLVRNHSQGQSMECDCGPSVSPGPGIRCGCVGSDCRKWPGGLSLGDRCCVHAPLAEPRPFVQ